ncbi:MAG: radical SAM protein [Oscillospiraceae bacterium]|nr:radical SAM protein [Oscillospiraceae bacterium]MDY6208827.1 radical SAM protein [Oscillospiraceae bacterium]
MNNILKCCTLCPRECRADRETSAGICGGGVLPRAAKAYLHMWEEPCISGTRGSGTVFFSGCSLKCCFCQNYKISAENFGKEITAHRLAEIFLELQDKGAHNINLVSPTHYVPQIISALDICGHYLNIPVAYNSGGYEKTETLEMLRGYVNIFMPDIKYFSPKLSEKYSSAPDYFEYASKAVSKMIELVGKPVIDENGIMKKGVIIRHMVLPSHRRDSEAVLREIDRLFDKDRFLLSLMSQYTPFYRSYEHKEINRRISTYEYNKVAELAAELGFKGYMQELSSAKEEYTPDFDLIGIDK